MSSAVFDRDFSVKNDEAGWTYPLLFEDEPCKKLYVSREFLGTVSPVLRKIFFDRNFDDSSKTELAMPGKKYKEFWEFVDCLTITEHADRKEVDAENLEILLLYSEEYQVPNLATRCAKFICQTTTTKQTMNLQQRQQYVRVFAACANTNADATVAQMRPLLARFPYPDLEILGELLRSPQPLVEVLQEKLRLHTQVAEYSKRLSTFKAERTNARANEDHLTCRSRRLDTAHRGSGEQTSLCGGYVCENCSLGSRCQMCAPCLDLHQKEHRTHGARCPKCTHEFRYSTESEMDGCFASSGRPFVPVCEWRYPLAIG